MVTQIKTNVKRFATSEVDITKAPAKDPEYSRWCDDIFDARYQIGLICEDNTIKSGVDWTDGAEGILSTE